MSSAAVEQKIDSQEWKDFQRAKMPPYFSFQRPSGEGAEVYTKRKMAVPLTDSY